MKVKIEEKNEQKIEALIRQAEKGSRARTVSYQAIASAVAWAETVLVARLNVGKQHWKGCLLTIRPLRVPNSYRFKAMGTIAVIKRGSTGWFLSDVERVCCGRRSGGDGNFSRVQLDLGEETRARIPNTFKTLVRSPMLT